MGSGGGWRHGLGLVVAAGLALGGVGCGHGGGAAGQPKQPMGHVEVKHLDSPDDAPDEAKTVQVSYVFDRDIANKDFQKSFKDGFDKKGLKVEEQLDARAHFEVTNAKITGTVTYVKKGMGRYSILDADLVAEANYAADVQVDLDVKVKGDTKKADERDWNGTALGGKPYPLVKNMMPVNIPIAGPLFLHAHFDLNAMCEVNVGGQMHATTGVGIKGDVRLSAKYKKAGFENTDPNGADDKKKKFKFEAKAPSFELAPKPYLKVEGKQQSIKGSCSLQPTAVLLVENMVGASLIVEPWIELEAKRSSSKAPWQLGAEAGVTVSAAPEVRVFGRKIGKKREFELMEVSLAKLSGPELGGASGATPKGLEAPPSKPGKKADTQIAGLLNDGLGEKPARPSTAAASSSSTANATANSTPASANSGIASSDPAASNTPPPSTGASSTSSAAAVASNAPSASGSATSAATPPTSASSAHADSPSPLPSDDREQDKDSKSSATMTADASSDTDDAPPPSKPKKKSGKALKALRAAAKPVSRNPSAGLAAGARKLLKKKAR